MAVAKLQLAMHEFVVEKEIIEILKRRKKIGISVAETLEVSVLGGARCRVGHRNEFDHPDFFNVHLSLSTRISPHREAVAWNRTRVLELSNATPQINNQRSAIRQKPRHVRRNVSADVIRAYGRQYHRQKLPYFSFLPRYVEIND